MSDVMTLPQGPWAVCVFEHCPGRQEDGSNPSSRTNLAGGSLSGVTCWECGSFLVLEDES